MVRIAYKLGLLQLANEKRWGPSHDLKLQNYVEALLAKGALGEVIQFVDGDGMKGYPQASRIKNYIKTVSGNGS